MARKYSVILGNLGNTKDRFCSGYKNNPSTVEMLKSAAAIPNVSGIELVGTWDIRSDNVAEMKIALADLGMKCVSIIPDLFADKVFWKGSYSSMDAKVREHSIDYTRSMCDIALEMGCDTLNIWPGQDGFDYLLCADYDSQRQWFAEAVAKLASAYPQLRFALEYKPKEPRTHSYVARMADTILTVQETSCENVGVCIDTGHAYVAQESVGESIVLAKRAGSKNPAPAGLLFHMHFNDNHGSWDDDMIVGTIHSTTYLDTLYWLDRCGYDGWISMDQYPYREDAQGAISESIQWLCAYDQIVDEHRSVIDELLQLNDAVETSRFLRSVMLPAVS